MNARHNRRTHRDDRQDEITAVREAMIEGAVSIEQVIAYWRQMIAAQLETLSWKQRLDGAQLWTYSIGRGERDENGVWQGDTSADLTVRCHEEYLGRTCAERMARVWSTPFGHYAEFRSAPDEERDMALLVQAEREREAGRLRLAERAGAMPGLPFIEPMLLEIPISEGMAEWPAGCPRRHGNMWLNIATLITESDGTRRHMNVFPAQSRSNI